MLVDNFQIPMISNTLVSNTTRSRKNKCFNCILYEIIYHISKCHDLMNKITNRDVVVTLKMLCKPSDVCFMQNYREQSRSRDKTFLFTIFYGLKVLIIKLTIW